MRILMAEHTFYRSLFQVGGQHLARALARRGHQVVYLSPPLNPLQLRGLIGARAAETRARFGNHHGGGERSDEGVFHYVPFTLVPFLRAPVLDSPSMLRRHTAWTMPGLARWIEQRGPFDGVVLGDVRYVPLLPRIVARRRFLRITDDLLSFTHVPRSVAHLVCEAAAVTDGFVITAEVLRETLPAGATPRAVHLVPNGVDPDHFQAPQPEPGDLAALPRPRAVYVGALESWFDVPRLAAAATSLPDVQFVIIGPARTSLAALEALDNVHLFGPRPYARVPAYLQHCQLGIIPFRSGRLTDGVSPLKLYEYLASGLPVVASAWAELRRRPSPALLVEPGQDLAAAMRRMLENPPPVDTLRDFAASNSWDERAGRLEALLAAG